ncbi:MAG TPA: hypothetical protein VFC10_16065 [Terriglobia bacterium]|jgi:Flp pilus assembly pilin Flp|nr:hypothetical protein [Terriglobia bacterium]
MADLAQRLWCEDKAQALTEYALVLILISLVIITSLKKVATEVREVYTTTARKVASPGTSGHESDGRPNGSSLWPAAWQPGLDGPTESESGSAQGSSSTSFKRSLR